MAAILSFFGISFTCCPDVKSTSRPKEDVAAYIRGEKSAHAIIAAAYAPNNSRLTKERLIKLFDHTRKCHENEKARGLRQTVKVVLEKDYGFSCVLHKLESLASVNSTNVDLLVRLGNLYKTNIGSLREDEKLKRAKEHLRRAYELKPKDPVVLLSYGDLLRRIRDFTLAETILTKAITKIDAENPEPKSALKHLRGYALASLADVLQHLGKQQQALERAKEAFKVAPRDVFIRYVYDCIEVGKPEQPFLTLLYEGGKKLPKAPKTSLLRTIPIESFLSIY